MPQLKMDREQLEQMLKDVAAGRCAIEAALEKLSFLPYEDLGFARLDHHRLLRQGIAEAVFAPGKTPEQIAIIVERIVAHAGRALVTRLSAAAATEVQALLQERHLVIPWSYAAEARMLLVGTLPEPAVPHYAAVVSAGTADIPIAEEAALTAAFLGTPVERVYDVGVAGLHRLLDHLPLLRRARIIVAVAGMEGALPSVLGGLVPAPIIAVPTSSGYGASFGGLAALLTMLNSCAPGVAVVNIDNGFGAGVLAHMITRNYAEG